MQLKVMFTWWISWLWAWLLLWPTGACVGGSVESEWAAAMKHEQGRVLEITQGLEIGQVPEIGQGLDIGQIPEIGRGLQLGRGPQIIVPMGEERVGPGMGGSAVQLLGLEGSQHFATQPTPQTAVVGSTVVFPCRVINKVGHLQWTKDGFGLGTERDLFGFSRYAMIGSDDEGDFSLRIQPVLLEDDGLYQCQVSASDGVPGIRSQGARLTVYVPPDPPKVTPPTLTATAGVPTTVRCESSGGRPAPEVQWVDESRRESISTGWTSQQHPLEDGKRVLVVSSLTFTPRRSHHNSSLTCLTSNQALSHPLTRWYHNDQLLANVTTSVHTLYKISRKLHQHSVSCEVSNKVGTSKKTQMLQVLYRPVFRILPRDVMAETGTEVTLRCDVDSNPPSSITWLRHGSDKILGSGSELRVVVESATAGVYVCVAAVRGFPQLEGRLRLLVKGPPTIVSAGEQRGRMGDTVNLECNTVSIPSPIRVTWTYNGKEIDLSDPRYAVVEDRQGEGLRNVLVIRDAVSHDFGAYNCSVVNEYGVARKQIRLNEETGRVPVVLVAGGVTVLLVMAVGLSSLFFCNKRQPEGKGDIEV
ncbi:irregular chiasm C-roughest protein-like isoform X3 [Cherax quadricarinatus]|uniref:irregular chiasm C-roughest protein-like isoform X3 n=1 Tax=Cherax quadricarinatus TaxID=27406 RepID=UPI00387E559B